MKKFQILFSLVLLMAGCKSATDSSGSSADDYFPLTKGSTWTYSGQPTKPGDTVYTLTVTRDTIFLGTHYTLQESTDPIAGTWGRFVRKSGDTVYMMGGMMSNNYLDQIFLDPTPGATWSYADVDHYHPMTTVWTFKNTERDLTRIVRSNTYTSVIHIAVTQDIDSAGSIRTAFQDLYFAKGIGLIEWTGTPWSNHYLLSYDVK